jgi:hypothetical protein
VRSQSGAVNKRSATDSAKVASDDFVHDPDNFKLPPLPGLPGDRHPDLPSDAARAAKHRLPDIHEVMAPKPKNEANVDLKKKKKTQKRT